MIIDAPFYSVDVVENLAGELRLVELGDGQVSDKKN
jgi:ATP-grasp domain, R2K clade family 3